MKFKVDSGLELVASEWGNVNDPLVVLMHGGGQTRHAWGSTGEVLSESGFYVLSLDLRGHGDSQWHPDGDYLIDSYKDDLISILNQVGKPASLVGASLGGMVSLSLASDLNKKYLVTSLVMVDIGLYPNEKGSNEIVSFMQSGIKGFSNLNEASDAVSAYLPHRKRPRDNRGLEKNLRLKEDGRYYWHWDPRFLDERDDDSRENQKEKNIRLAKNISIPTLLIRGALSNVVTQKEVDDFLTIIPHSEFQEIEKAAHMVAGDRNDIFANSAIKFLKKISTKL
jgi:pimeloyl-ACP methyl ester carboxylesterase